MKDASVNEGFHDRIEFAEELFQRSNDYEGLLQEWQDLTYTIEKLLKEHELNKEIFQLDELVQALFLGAAKYGYMTGYQDAKHNYIEGVYFDFIQRWNKEYTIPPLTINYGKR